MPVETFVTEARRARMLGRLSTKALMDEGVKGSEEGGGGEEEDERTPADDEDADDGAAATSTNGAGTNDGG
jgi:hypothetical protein